jgi:ADP-ribose pyrophosphatase YjhB (NUDIX family)
MDQYSINLIKSDKDLPEDKDVSAVFLIGFVDNKILTIRNERGFDIPGGHLEKGETVKDALVREVKEEASAEFKEEKPILYLSSDSNKKVMLFYTSSKLELEEFQPFEDSFEREILTKKIFLQKYFGDKDLMRKVLDNARRD